MLQSFLLRTGIVAGAVIYSAKLGVWGNTHETEKIYHNVKEELRPHFAKLGKDLEIGMPTFTQTDEFSFLATRYYNQAVKDTFQFIEKLPAYVKDVPTYAEQLQIYADLLAKKFYSSSSQFASWVQQRKQTEQVAGQHPEKILKGGE